MVVTGRNILGGGKETGGEDNDNIRARFGGGGGHGIERGLRSSLRELADRVERNGVGQLSDQPRQTTSQNTAGRDYLVEKT